MRVKYRSLSENVTIVGRLGGEYGETVSDSRFLSNGQCLRNCELRSCRSIRLKLQSADCKAFYTRSRSESSARCKDISGALRRDSVLRRCLYVATHSVNTPCWTRWWMTARISGRCATGNERISHLSVVISGNGWLLLSMCQRWRPVEVFDSAVATY